MPRKPVTDPHKVWNIAHHKRLEAYNKRIEQLLNRAITQAADLAMRHGAEATADNPFSYSDDKQLKAETEKLLKDLSKEITAVTKSAEGKEWDKAYQQATEYLSQVYNVAKQAEALQGLFDERLLGMKARNLEALNAFQQRKIGGLKLSDKVWNYTKDFEKQMEVSIDQALLEGKSAAELSRDIRSLLKDPDLLFRRVRDDNDQLRTSKAMEAFHPGTGKYRSAYANAMRLARSEINIAYRSSDTQTAQDFDACVGIEVHLSNNHNCKGVPDGEFYDICDELQGKYPKDFKFTGWHPQCRCYTTYILKTDEEFWRDLEDGVKRESVNTVKDVPDNFKEWVARNEDRIAKAEERGTTPYFIRDNKEVVNAVLAELNKPFVMTDSVVAELQSKGFNIQSYGTIGVPVLSRDYNNSPISGFNLKEFYNEFEHLLSDRGVAISGASLEIRSNRVDLTINGRDKAGSHVTLERVFIKNKEGLTVVDHELFSLSKPLQGTGLSKDTFKALFNQYQKMGADRVDVFANIDVGGYTWARYGFYTTEFDIKDILQSTNINASEKALVRDIVEQNKIIRDGKTYINMRPISELPFAKRLLLGTYWQGYIFLDDKAQMNTLLSYINS